MIAYGYKSTGDGDVILKTVDKAMEDFAIIFAPGAFLADVFPIRESITFFAPSYSPDRSV